MANHSILFTFSFINTFTHREIGGEMKLKLKTIAEYITYDAYVNEYDIVDQRYQHLPPYYSHVRINRARVVHDYSVDPSGYS